MSAIEFRTKGSFICKDCEEPCTATMNDRCHVCANKAQEEWSRIYRHRQDASKLDTQKLVNLLLTQVWQHHCEIIPDYMPPFPREDTQPTCVIKHGEQFLRYSNGPLQGFFWDMYGDDFHSPELAIVALSQCQPPRGATCVTTHGN